MSKDLKTTEVAKIPEASQEVLEAPHTEEEVSAEALISLAIQKKVPVETMERLLAMKKDIDAQRAKKRFIESMAAFQADCPTINKTKEVKTRAGIVAYRYAPIESIIEQVKPLLKKHGFSYSTDMELLVDGVKAICKVTHAGGHSENSQMSVPLGNKTDVMSRSQVVAAAQTFAKRYAFCNAFGILTGDEDTDGSIPGVPVPPNKTFAPKKEAPKEIDRPENIKVKIQSKLLTIKGESVITAENVKEIVKELTQLELVEENFQEIYNRLSVIVDQMKESKKQ